MTPQQAKALALVAVSQIEAKTAAEEQRRDELRKTFLNDQEIETLILAVLRTRGDLGVTDEVMTKIINEFVSIRFMNSCVDLALAGLLDVDYDSNLPENDRLMFRSRKDIQGPLQAALQQRRGAGGT